MLNGVPSPERHPFVPSSQSDLNLPIESESLPWVDPEFEQLSAYIDGELSAPEARAVEDWLATDQGARRLYCQLNTMQAAFDQVQVPTRSAVEIDQMAEQVFAGASRPVLRLVPQPIYQKVAAALVLVLGSGLSTWQWHTPQPLISIEDPPVAISSLPLSARMAERYLLHPPASQDPYSILFVEVDL